MKQLKLWMLAAILIICGATTFTSCTNEDEPVQNEEQPVIKSRVTAMVHNDDAKMTIYVIEYPSTDPYGNPTTLSGTITVGDEVTKEVPAKGLLLYNHFTVYRANQCPSKGDLKVQTLMAGSGLITVSPDYYGFGITEDKPQAYCNSRANAQASVDALLAAKELLPTLGYSWNDDILFNAGYSQGGQTTMGVVRLIDEKYPDLHITYTFAGGGSYDIPATYAAFIQAGQTGMPSSVISVLLSYNEFYKLGIPREDIFIEPLLSNIDAWILSKQYTSNEIDQFVGSYQLSDFVTPAMLDITSPLSQRFLQALAQDNICQGWTPRKNQHILLVHHTEDITVPAVNALNMYNFLKAQGVEDVQPYIGNFGYMGNYPAHETAAVVFVTLAVGKVCDILDTDVWFKIEDIL